MATDQILAPQRTPLDRFAQFIVQFVPDAVTASILLLLVLVTFALLLGNSPLDIAGAYYQGFWSLLPFTGQMTLTIVLGSALGASPWFQRAIGALARLPRTRNQMVALAVLLSGCFGYFFWSLGYALGPLVAVLFAKEAERKGFALHFPFFLATLYAATSVWQFGLSSSAPLLIATDGHFLEKLIGVIPLARTIWSPAAILDIALFTAAVMLTGALLMPKSHHPLSDYPGALQASQPVALPAVEARTFTERLEAKPYAALILVAALLVWLWYHFAHRSAGLNINSMNVTLLLLTFLLHGNIRAVTKALENASASAWQILVLYTLYAGLSGMIEHTRIGVTIASFLSTQSSPATFPTLSAAVGTIFAFFIPSSGGQWALQGLVTVKASQAVGVTVERGLLSMSVGDHMGNLISPFWYVIAAGMLRMDFRTFFGYGLIYAVIWFLIGIVVFTVAPC